jgi:5S rRNA maturation endonuclease (ribonuclease M5)
VFLSLLCSIFIHSNGFPLIVFNKKNVLFGIDLAAKTAFKENKVLIVEGYFDVIALHEIGVKNVVACMGTALGLEQLFLAARLSRDGNVIVLLDNDGPGQSAMNRVCNLVKNYGKMLSKRFQNISDFDADTPPLDPSTAHRLNLHFATLDSVKDLFVANTTQLDNTVGGENQCNVGHSTSEVFFPKDCGDIVQKYDAEFGKKVVSTIIDRAKVVESIIVFDKYS